MPSHSYPSMVIVIFPGIPSRSLCREGGVLARESELHVRLPPWGNTSKCVISVPDQDLEIREGPSHPDP